MDRYIYSECQSVPADSPPHMSMKKAILIVGCTFAYLVCQGQGRITQFHCYVGTALFPKEKQNELMNGYGPGFTIGAGLSMGYNKFIFNPNLEVTTASKAHHSLFLLTLHNNLKYYFMEDSKVRPYVMILANISFVSLHAEANQAQSQPAISYSVSGLEDIPVDQITYRNPEVKLQFAPTFGGGLGAGFDIAAGSKYSFFIQYSYTVYSSKSSSLLNNNFPNNTSALSLQNIVLGVRLHKSTIR